ncbi:MAG TPA: hypothetical protein VMN60_14355 [Longimicrobiales bacterium]|nr:hypothetical protein [Longimicrobiales bacterium]
MSVLRPAGLVIDRDNPWPGLVSFPEEAEAYFSGRDAERDELLRLIRRDTLTLLHGQSGLGKTSLLMAGLFPALRRDNYLPVYVRIDHALDSPPAIQQMMAHLLGACADQHVEAPAVTEGESLWEYLHRKSTGFWSERMRPVTPVFVIDQFEEVLTIGRATPAHAARSQQFLADLTDLVNNAVPAQLEQRLATRPEEAALFTFRRNDYRIVVGAREDFVPELEHGLREQMPSILTNKLRLERLSGDRAYTAIQKTGAHLVSPAVAELIVRFLAGRRADENVDDVALRDLQIEPALLSLFCRELNEERKARRLPVLEKELLSGSKDEILSNFYRESVSDLGEPMRVFVEERLLTESGYRNSFALDDALRQPGVTRDAVDALIARRLIRLEERFGILRVELTHDVLTGIVKESRDRRRRIEAQAEQKAREEAEHARLRAAAAAARRKNRWYAAAAITGFLMFAVTGAFALSAVRSEEAEQVALAAAQDSAAAAQLARREASDSAQVANRARAAADVASTQAIEARQRAEAALEDLRVSERREALERRQALVYANALEEVAIARGDLERRSAAQESVSIAFARITDNAITRAQALVDSANTIAAQARSGLTQVLQRDSARVAALETLICEAMRTEFSAKGAKPPAQLLSVRDSVTLWLGKKESCK